MFFHNIFIFNSLSNQNNSSPTLKTTLVGSIRLYIIIALTFIISFHNISYSQSCNNWVQLPNQPSFIRVGDLDIPGNKITVEALVNRTAPWNGVDLFQGDVVSKHEDPKDCNYLLRPSSAEITTTNGYYKTPTICPIQLNKTYHVAMTYDGAALKFYRNGYLMSQIAATGNMILNNWQTQIGLYFNQTTVENLIGYINEVKIWNVVRTQQEIQSSMSTSLSSPQTMTGLLAYYTFDNLINKQGNAQWDGKLGGNASINTTNPNCKLIADSCGITPCTNFLAPDFDYAQDVCNPKSIRFTSSVSNMKLYEWNFGNGQISGNNENVSTTYTSYGNYPITLKVVSNEGCEESVTKTINVSVLQSDIIYTRDTSVCFGDSLILRTDPSSIDYCWLPIKDLSNSQSNQPVAKPQQTTEYTFTSKTIKDNLVVNGNFSSGNNGFQSEYVYSTNGIAEGVYSVSANVTAWHAGLSPCSDHTTGAGNMLLVNGSGLKDVKVWYQNIKVVPNTNYVFSAWIQSLSTFNPAHLQFSINGNRIGNDIKAANQTCQWNRFYNTWNSGNNTSATIAIINVNQALTGNDFALDDVFFGEVVMKQETVKVIVNTKPNLIVTKDTLVCESAQIQLNAEGASTYSWSPSNSLTSNNTPNPIASPRQTTKYYVSATGNNGCTVKDSILVSVKPKPNFNVSPLNASVCEGDTLALRATGSDYIEWIVGQDMMINAAEAKVYPKFPTSYRVVMKDLLCQLKDTLSVSVKVNAYPKSFVTKSNDIDCSNTTSQLLASGAHAYKWFPSAGLSNANIPNPIATPRQTSTYFVEISSLEGCTTKDSVTIQVSNAGNNNFYIPNAFTPDGNGKNDCFGVRFWGDLEEFSFNIFNRWGEKVFSTTSNNNCWDGKYKGVQQPEGIYVYTIKGKTFCGNVIKQGTVLLTR